MNDLWWSEVCRHTLRDQLSIDYCAWRCGLRLGRFKGVHSNNPLFRFNYYERPTNDF